ncbi:MAG: hypothetical protein ACJ8H8_20495 [Geminicoccaceae bacterium]
MTTKPSTSYFQLAAELAVLGRHGLQVRAVVPGDRRRVGEALRDAVLLWHGFAAGPVTAELLGNAPWLDLVQALGSGAEAIDLAAAKTRRMPFAPLPAPTPPPGQRWC